MATVTTRVLPLPLVEGDLIASLKRIERDRRWD